MNSTLPGDQQLQNPDRIEVLVNGAEPFPYTVKTYRYGQVVATTHFATESEAKEHQAAENDRIGHANRT